MSKTLELTKTNQENQSSDLISWCVEDIIAKLEKVEYYKEKTENERENIKLNLYLEFHSLTMGIKQLGEVDDQQLNHLDHLNYQKKRIT